MRLTTVRQPGETAANMTKEQVIQALGEILTAMMDHGEVTLEMGTVESGAIVRSVQYLDRDAIDNPA